MYLSSSLSILVSIVTVRYLRLRPCLRPFLCDRMAWKPNGDWMVIWWAFYGHSIKASQKRGLNGRKRWIETWNILNLFFYWKQMWWCGLILPQGELMIIGDLQFRGLISDRWCFVAIIFGQAFCRRFTNGRISSEGSKPTKLGEQPG